MYPLFESPKLDRELRSMIRENFREFCTVGINTEMNHNNPIDHPAHQPQQYHITDDSRLQPQPPILTSTPQPQQPIGETLLQPLPPFFRSGSSDTELDNDVKFSDDDEPTEPAVKSEETDDDDDLPLSKVNIHRVFNHSLVTIFS